MKLKQTAEDFKVYEISDIRTVSKGPYKLYLLEKKGIETFNLLNYMSKANKIPVNDFGIAGLKDKHAVTTQHLTIPSKYGIKTLVEKNLNIKFLGYTPKRLSSGELQANRFEITVRDIKKGELEGIKQKSKDISWIGVPNYFDSQRFGSVINKSFIAKYLIKGDYEEAVKTYLTEFTKSEKGYIKNEKRMMLQGWNNITKLNIKNNLFQKIIAEYRTTKSWLEAYKKIPSKIREMFISAYQSYLWNECIKKVLVKSLPKNKLYDLPYNIGDIVFYKSITSEELKKIPETFQMIFAEMQAKDHEKSIINDILAKEGISLKDLDIKQESGNYFGSYSREVLLKPAEFSISEPVLDELNDKGKNNRFKVTVSFILPKGSYATVITKRLFNQ